MIDTVLGVLDPTTLTGLDVHMTTALQHLAAPALTPLTEGGVLDWVNDKTTEATTTLKTVGGLLAVGFIIHKAYQARGGLAAIIVGGLSAAVFLWLINNVGTVKDRVNSEVNGMPAVVSTPHPGVPATPVAPAASEPDGPHRTGLPA